jgi:EAL domain-containing protein (putative c-di-GMP-specific phosphodiesterase class I)
MISASVGTTVDGALVASADELFQHVDHALYAAKRAGRRRVVAFDDDLRADLESRIGLGEALRRAVTGGQIEVWGQPIVDLHTGATVWIELLARWRHTDGLHIPPSVFVPLAEETGLITEITEQMLVHAMRVHRHLRCHPELASARLTVNVSPLDLVAGSLTELVAKLVEENGVQPGELVLEVTESRVLDDVDRARAVLHEVRALGVELAIDDFGSGYSSLNQLLSLPISIVKLDRSLIAGLAGNPRQLALIRSIGNLGRTVGHDVIAEGVEHEVQADMLRRLGYTFAQGYLFARPTPITELTGMPPVGGEAPREPDRGGLPVLDGSLG